MDHGLFLPSPPPVLQIDCDTLCKLGEVKGSVSSGNESTQQTSGCKSFRVG